MNDPENFLTRWSRKKRGALDEPAAAPPAKDAATDASAANDSNRPPEPHASSSPPETAFDPASLPSLDSIEAGTDMRGFLRPGVPPGLTRAALRRAWSADPAIRDFKGLQENDWDFNDPNAMAGFGKLDPDFDVNRMLASVFGETPKEVTEANAVGSERSSSGPNQDEQPEDRVEIASSASVAARDEDEIVRRNIDVASQDMGTASPNDSSRRVRTHGSALPRYEND